MSKGKQQHNRCWMSLPAINNKRASDHWFRTDGLASMHKNNMSNINPRGLMMQKQLAWPNLHSQREMQDHRRAGE